jgi:hypothetical protein
MHSDACVITCQTDDVTTQIPKPLFLYAVHKGVSTPVFRQITPLQIGMFVESVYKAEFSKAKPYFQ